MTVSEAPQYSPLQGKNILLGVSGGIAVYKVCDWLRHLRRAGAEVTVIMTRSATEFVAPLTFSALSGNRVHTEMFDPQTAEQIPHIRLAQAADLILVAPATANSLARFANGLADDLLSTSLLAAHCPVLLCPAMNSTMYANRATQNNLERLRQYGATIIEPAIGEMACGDSGPGRLPEWDIVFEEIVSALTPHDFAGQKLLITAGPTEEPLDPVRFLSNRSSGKMGYALAKIARRRGAAVTLVSGPTSLPTPAGVDLIQVRTAEEMLHAVNQHAPHMSIIIKAAAVSDFRPQICAAEKIKKGEEIESLTLVANQDILHHLGRNRKGSVPMLVGFAAESSHHLEEGQRKLRDKGADMIIVNDIIGECTGFQADTNKVTILHRSGKKETLPLLSKDETAVKILDTVRAVLP